MAYKDKITGIYSITHLPSGKKYIGSACNIYTRWAAHRHLLRKDKHSSIYLQRAWNKYPSSEFEFVIVEVVGSADQLVEREQHWIDTVHPVYNTCPAAGSTAGIKWTDAQRERHIEERRKRCQTPEFREKMRQVQKTNRADPEFCRRMAEGIKSSLENPDSSRLKSEAMKTSWSNPEVRERRLAANKKGLWSPESRAKSVTARIGGKRSPETKAKMSDARKKWSAENPDLLIASAQKRTGRKRTPETCAKISAAHKKWAAANPERVKETTAKRIQTMSLNRKLKDTLKALPCEDYQSFSS